MLSNTVPKGSNKTKEAYPFKTLPTSILKVLDMKLQILYIKCYIPKYHIWHSKAYQCIKKGLVNWSNIHKTLAAIDDFLFQ